MDLYLRYLFLAFYFVTACALECYSDYQCANKNAKCDSSSRKCVCKYGGSFITSGNSCYECNTDQHCLNKNAKCDLYSKVCVCKYGGSFNTNGNSCYECYNDEHCTAKYAKCGPSNKCMCKKGGSIAINSCNECISDSDCSDPFTECGSISKMCICKHSRNYLNKCTECIIDSDCDTSYSECDWNNKCVCRYGGEVHHNGKLISCSANTVGIVVGVIVAGAVVTTIVVIIFLVRRRRLQRLNQTRTAVWVQSAGAVQGLPVAPQPYQPTYPVQQYQPVTTNQGHVNDGYAHSQQPSAPYMHEANK